MELTKEQAALSAEIRGVAQEATRFATGMMSAAIRYAAAQKAMDAAKNELRAAEQVEESEEMVLRAIAEAQYADSKDRKETPKGVLSASTAEGRKAQMEQHLHLTRQSGVGTLSGAWMKAKKLREQAEQKDADYSEARVLWDANKAYCEMQAARFAVLRTAFIIEGGLALRPIIQSLKEDA
jgi:hypothetical protein